MVLHGAVSVESEFDRENELHKDPGPQHEQLVYANDEARIFRISTRARVENYLYEAATGRMQRSIRRNRHEGGARVRLFTDKFSFRPSITRRPSLFTGSLSFTVINGTRYRCAAEGTSPPIFAILQHPTISCETYEHVETRWPLSRREFKYFATLVDGYEEASVSRKGSS